MRRYRNLSKPKKKTKQEQAEQKPNEDKEFQEFVSTAMRAPRTGPYEQLLSQFLCAAVVVTDPLKRIKTVCEAALMVPDEERKDIAIDYEKVEVLNNVANPLLNFTVRNFLEAEVRSIPWGFALTEENFKKFIEPWLCILPIYYPHLLRQHVVLGKATYPWQLPPIVKIIFEPHWSHFFDSSSCLSVDGYGSLKSSFIAWAISDIQHYLAELTSVVSPSTYNEILGLYNTTPKKGRKSYSEKIKTTSTEISKDEGSMDPGL